MRSCYMTALSLLAFSTLPIQAQDTKVDKTKAGVVSSNPDAGRQHIQITGGTPPSTGSPTGSGGRPPMQVDAQINVFKSEIADLQALAEKQKALVASLSSMVNTLQQDNNKLWAKNIALELAVKDLQATAKDYQTHVHTLGNGFGFTQQGNFYLVTTPGVAALKHPTSGPQKGN